MLYEEMKCPCGKQGRYSHNRGGKQVPSCNKHVVCLSYKEQTEKINYLYAKKVRYEIALEKIVRINGMDYEYAAWAKEALDE